VRTVTPRYLPLSITDPVTSQDFGVLNHMKTLITRKDQRRIHVGDRRFPRSLRQCRQGREKGDQGMARGWCTLYTACEFVYDRLGNPSMHIQDLYVGTFPRFIKNL